MPPSSVLLMARLQILLIILGTLLKILLVILTTGSPGKYSRIKLVACTINYCTQSMATVLRELRLNPHMLLFLGTQLKTSPGILMTGSPGNLFVYHPLGIILILIIQFLGTLLKNSLVILMTGSRGMYSLECGIQHELF